MALEESVWGWLKYAWSSPLAAPLLAPMYTYVETYYPKKGVQGPPLTIPANTSYSVVEHSEEAGILRSALLASDSPKLRYSIKYSVAGVPREWDFSYEDLDFVGYIQPNDTVPWAVQCATKTHPFLGTSVDVCTVMMTPRPETSFYDGYIEARIYNPTSSSVNVWLVYADRWVLRPGILRAAKMALGIRGR